MQEAAQFLLEHGYAVLFALVFAEQIGLPLPAIPILLATGAMAGTGHFSFTLALLVAVLAALLADCIWYQLGRYRGHSVLNLLCRISLEPDSCVRRTEDVFARHGASTLLFAKFVPGLNVVAPPLAGMLRMRPSRFLVSDGLGAIFWVGAFAGAGYLFAPQLERVAAHAAQMGAWLLALLLGSLVVFLGWKYVQRQRFLRELRMARIRPEELMQKLKAGEEMVIVDLRHLITFEADGEKVPGALHVPPAELDARHQEIPRDRDVVLYCT